MQTIDRPTTADWGATVLRVSLGVMFLAHSVVLKLMTYGLTGTADFFRNVGLPGWLAYVTFASELVGGLFLVLGIPGALGRIGVITRYPAQRTVHCAPAEWLGVHEPEWWLGISRVPVRALHRPVADR